MTHKDDLAYPDPMRGADSSFINQDPSSNQSGLSKREYFAAMATIGILSSGRVNVVDSDISRYSVEHADALIEALNKQQ